MPFSDAYRRRVELLLRVLPSVAKENRFALKGGTAINLFIRDLPRLSVDIDLAYVHALGRKRALPAITTAMNRIGADIEKTVRGAHATRVRLANADNAITGLNIQMGRAHVKIELSPVLRGCAYQPEVRAVSEVVETEFGFAETQVLSFADVYAGKLVAALDRQHPRDLFDVRDLLANEGIDDDLRSAFIVYLISHTRPMGEVLAVPRKDLSKGFSREFEGMTASPVALSELIQTREELVRILVTEMPEAHREFLISFELGEPEWGLLSISHARHLPAVKWRQQNLDSISKKKRAALVAHLEEVLEAKDKLAQRRLL